MRFKINFQSIETHIFGQKSQDSEEREIPAPLSLLSLPHATLSRWDSMQMSHSIAGGKIAKSRKNRQTFPND